MRDRLRSFYWWHVSVRVRRWRESLIWKAAWWLPRSVALMAFVRVYSCTGDAPGPDYANAYRTFEQGAGR